MAAECHLRPLLGVCCASPGPVLDGYTAGHIRSTSHRPGPTRYVTHKTHNVFVPSEVKKQCRISRPYPRTAIEAVACMPVMKTHD